MAVVGCLVLALLFVGDHVGRPPNSGAAAYLAPDGASWYGERNTSSAGGATTSGTVTEASVVEGTAVAGAVDFQLGGAILGATGAESPARSRFWRTTTSTVEAPVVRDTQVYRVNTDVVLVGESGPNMSYIYAPGLVELPTGVAPDTSWESTGTAGTGITYRAQFRATAGTANCLLVTGTINYVSGAGQLQREIQKTWCPGAGVVAVTERTADRATGWARAARPSISTPITANPPSTWKPATWQPREFLSTSVDPSTGRSPMPGAPAALPPVFTATGVLVRAGVSGQDLLAFTPSSAGEWALRWRGHPGGTVLSLSVFGNVVVATTSDRQVVGYSDQGLRLWGMALDEVAPRAPVRATAGELALVTMSGEVLVVDLASGSITWRSQPGVDVGVAPVVSAGMLTIADRRGALIGLDVSTGEELWRTDSSSVAYLAAIGSVLTVVSEGDIYGVDIHTGRRLWRAAYLGIERGLVAFGDWVVLTHVGGSTAYDAAGRQVWDEPGVHAVSTAVTDGSGASDSSDQGFLVRWDRARADVLDRGGKEITSFVTPEDTAGNTQRFATGPAGVYQFDGSWRFRGWTR